MSIDLTGDLFADYERLARKSDPATSHAAAARVSEFAASHHALIVLCLKDHGPQTIDEMAARILDKWAIARRMPELETLKAVRVVTISGQELTRPGKSGRAQRVWQAT